ncbi:hypothetical protein WA158_001276 [Blastocystis sp. Blastoise]
MSNRLTPVDLPVEDYQLSTNSGSVEIQQTPTMTTDQVMQGIGMTEIDELNSESKLTQSNSEEKKGDEVKVDNSSIIIDTEEKKEDEDLEAHPSPNCFTRFFAPGSIRGATFNLCSATLGAGALSLASACQMTGWALGAILLLIGAFVTVFTIDLMILARKASHFDSYESLALGLFGKIALFFVNIGVLVFCLGTAIGYIIAIRDIMDNVIGFGFLPDILNNKYLLTSLFWLILMLPLSLLRSMDNLRFSSFIGIITVTYLAIVSIILCIVNFSAEKFNSIPAFSFSSKVLNAIPIMLFAFSSQVNVYEIQTELGNDKDKKMKPVARYGMTISSLIYICMGVSGFLTYGNDIKGNILLNFASTPEPYVIAGFFAITFTIIMAFPLNIFPARFTLISMIWGTKAAEKKATTKGEIARHYIISFLLSFCCLIVGSLVDDLSVVFNFIGGVASTLLCFAFPAICCLYLKHKKLLRLSTFLTISCWLLLVFSVVVGSIQL